MTRDLILTFNAGSSTIKLGFYALAALDRFLPEASPLKRLSSTANTFVVMMAAAACAASILFVPPQTLWKQVR